MSNEHVNAVDKHRWAGVVVKCRTLKRYTSVRYHYRVTGGRICSTYCRYNHLSLTLRTALLRRHKLQSISICRISQFTHARTALSSTCQLLPSVAAR